MQRSLLLVLLFPFAALAQEKAKAPPITPAVPGTCTIVGNMLVTDMRDTACFPQFDEAKCSYFMQIPAGRTVGASEADVADLRKHGELTMKYAATQVCEGKANCGFYVFEFAAAANCDGKVQQNMPGGEYRGLTAAAVNNIQARVNRENEAAWKSGKSRGDNAKNPKNKGKVWGADE